MSENHSYGSLQLPNNASFELKPCPNKGWGVFATKRIRHGSLILREKALFVIRKSPLDITEVDVCMALSQLSPNQKAQFALLPRNGSEQFTSMAGFMAVLAENIFEITGEFPAFGLYPIGSRFNHSCLPNARFPSIPGQFIEIYATQDIEAGEEICLCYHPDLLAQTRAERHEYLKFECDCKACVPGTPFQQLSDLRRRMIRGLLYITRGVDLDGKKQISQSPLIVVPELKATAEACNLPLTTRLVLQVLIIVLLEEEGLLDDQALRILEIDVFKPMALLHGEYNKRIAWNALGYGNWIEIFPMMSKLYGLKDPSDDMVTQEYQRRSREYSGGAPRPPWA